jgi:large subunit ribosomal protein L10
VALKRSEKEESVQELTHIFNTSGAVVFTRFTRLTVEESNAMRRELRTHNIGYKVAKKTLAQRALKDSNLGAEMEKIEGELAIAYSDDATAAPREIFSFQKKYDGKIFIEGGVFQNEVMNREKMVEIAQIPSLLVLRGMFVNLINSPIQRFAVVLNQIAQTKN